MTTTEPRIGGVYWHRELPPFAAEFMGEHTIETTSMRVPGNMAHRDELWDQCHRDLMAQTQDRLGLEMRRLGGDYAHVIGEAIDARRNEAAGETWLQGRFRYALYRRAAVALPGASVVA